MKKLLIAVFLLTGCTSVEEKQAYRDAQIQMVEKQLLARQQMQIDMARAQAAWANAMAEVAKPNPESADAIAVGLAVAAARNNEAENGAPIVQLQREENEARAWAQVLAAPVLNTVGLVATTAINANVQKNASDNMAKISINESEIAEHSLHNHRVKSRLRARPANMLKKGISSNTLRISKCFRYGVDWSARNTL